MSEMQTNRLTGRTVKHVNSLTTPCRRHCVHTHAWLATTSGLQAALSQLLCHSFWLFPHSGATSRSTLPNQLNNGLAHLTHSQLYAGSSVQSPSLVGCLLMLNYLRDHATQPSLSLMHFIHNLEILMHVHAYRNAKENSKRPSDIYLQKMEWLFSS